jgi:hypothetical protein
MHGRRSGNGSGPPRCDRHTAQGERGRLCIVERLYPRDPASLSRCRQPRTTAEASATRPSIRAVLRRRETHQMSDTAGHLFRVHGRIASLIHDAAIVPAGALRLQPRLAGLTGSRLRKPGRWDREGWGRAPAQGTGSGPSASAETQPIPTNHPGADRAFARERGPKANCTQTTSRERHPPAGGCSSDRHPMHAVDWFSEFRVGGVSRPGVRRYRFHAAMTAPR